MPARAWPRALAVAAFGIALVWTGSARAQPDVRELRHDTALDASITGAGIAVLVVTEVFKDTLGPRQCRWCDTNGAGHDVLNPIDLNVRSTLRWHDPAPARAVSNITAFIAQPLLSAGTLSLAAAHDEAGSHAPTDLLLVLQAATISSVVNQAVKFTFARERPFVHVLAEEDKPRQEHFSDNNLSFYSGHTSLTFALATASGTIASLRNYRLAPMVWATLLPVAAFTGYLRIAGDRHYFTDVFAGAVLGSAAGILVPLLFHGRAGTIDDAPNPGAGAGAGTSGGASASASSLSTPTITFGGSF